ncbi:MAG: hypothetical protein GXY36_13370 [Chloroflexi bacterium]|jgi:hypothetical protein|nr:hypothetical protein [Chloroflexota bacterium]
MTNQTPFRGVQPDDGQRRITIDAEHFSIRFLVPVLTLGSVIVFHLVGMAVLDRVLDEGVNVACIVLPLDVLVFLGLGYVYERVLKRVMPSKRYALLSDETLIVADGREKNPPQQVTLTWDQTINPAAWRFVVRRRTRVPKGWFCLALQLLQDEESIIFYTFMPQDEAEALPGYKQFVRLRPRKEVESSTDLRGVAEQRRYLKLEDERWNDGAEIAPDDFRAVLMQVARHVPGWVI